MANLHSSFAGIESPNPFWLASAPPTDKAVNVIRAFEAGWGGVVWKTLGEAGPPVVNVNGPRYGALLSPDRRLLGFNNIELITDRDLEVNLREISQVKRDWPDRAMVVSLMVPCEEASWKAILPRVTDTGAVVAAATAVAVVPAAGGAMATDGAETYPEPGESTRTAHTADGSKDAVAVAPVPPPPLMSTAGALV